MPLRVVARDGRPHLYLRGTVRGESVFESTGTSDPKIAEQIRIKTEARLLEETVHGKKATVTFEEAADAYMVSGGSTRFLAPLIVHFRGRRIRTIGQAELDAAARILYPNCAPETRNRQCYTPFIAVWTYAVTQDWADIRQWRRPRKPKGTNVRHLAAKERAGTKPITYERAATFVAAMSPAPAYVMTTLFYTGLRPIELFALRAEDINLADRWLVVPHSKTGEPRGVPIHDFLISLLTPLVERGGVIFRTPRDEPYPMLEDGGGQLKTAIIGARKRSGINDVSPYTARHTVSTQLVVNGVHQHIKDQILGHAADDMSRHYTHVPQAPLIEAINTLQVPALWRAAPWLADPIGFQRRLAAGTGRRTDLQRKAI